MTLILTKHPRSSFFDRNIDILKPVEEHNAQWRFGVEMLDDEVVDVVATNFHCPAQYGGSYGRPSIPSSQELQASNASLVHRGIF